MQRVTVPNEVLLPQVEAMVAEGTSVTLRVKGNSMLPFIVGGRDSVVLQKADSLHRGDIVLAQGADHRYVLHRIVRIAGSQVTLMGNGNLQGTEQCQAARITAKAVSILRGGKHIACNSRTERRKAMVWQRLLPVRRYLLAIYRRTELLHKYNYSDI